MRCNLSGDVKVTFVGESNQVAGTMELTFHHDKKDKQ